jgi:CheY-like chemotaxis protein
MRCIALSEGILEIDGLQVYVVDDNQDSADSLADLLTRMGHSATACYSGITVLELARQAKPDCVLLDIAMRDMDGLELTRTLRTEFGDDIVLIAITGAPEDSPAVRSTFDLVDHYFVKPLDANRLNRILTAD